MTNSKDLRSLPNEPAEASLVFSLKCGVPAIARTTISSLVRQGFRHDYTASTVIVLDSPRGFAPDALQGIEMSSHRVIIATWSFCPEYWEDLWDLRPSVLLVGEGTSTGVG